MQQKTKEPFFTVSIPGKVGIKKNSRKQIRDRYGRTRNVPSERYSNWESIAAPHICQALVRQPRSFPIPATFPIHAEFEFHFKNERALPDTSNCIEGPQDVMQTCGVYANDRQIVSISATRYVSGVEKTVVNLFEINK